MFLIMKLLYLKQKIKFVVPPLIEPNRTGFEDSRCFFLSTFCFLLDIFRQKICQRVERAFPRPRDEAVVSKVTDFIPDGLNDGSQATYCSGIRAKREPSL